MTSLLHEITASKYWQGYYVVTILSIVVCAYLYRYQLNPDGITYIHIAENLSSGNTTDGILGHASPLYPLLLIPFISLGITSLTATKIVSSLAAILAIVSVHLMTMRFKMSRTSRFAAVFSTTPLIIFSTFIVITPDVLLSGFFLIYLYLCTSPSFLVEYKTSIVIGIIAGLSFLTKSFFLPFFLIHILVCTTIVMYTKQIQAREMAKKFVVIMFIASILCLPWITLLSLKYEKLTFSTSGQIERAITSPHLNQYTPLHLPMFNDGLFEPPFERATSILEDVSTLNLPIWSPIESAKAFKHQLSVIITNTGVITKSLFTLHPFSLLFILILIVHFYVNRKSPRTRTYFIILTGVVIFLSGYALVWVMPRYLLPAALILTVTGLATIDEFHNVKQLSYRQYCSILAAVVLITSIGPFYRLVTSYHDYTELYNISIELTPLLVHLGPLASNTNYHESLYLSYYLNRDYYGKLKSGISDDERLKNLREFNIAYYLHKGEAAHISFKEIAYIPSEDITVYALPQ